MGKRILYVCSARCYISDNPSRKVHDILKCWKIMGYTTELFSGGDMDYDAENKSLTGNNSKHVNLWLFKNGLLSPLFHTVSEKRDIERDIKLEARIEDIIKKNRPDIIWERSSRLSIAPLRMAHKYGIPFILEWKDHLIDYSLSLYRHRAIVTEIRKNREADFIVIESEKLRNDLIAQGVEPDKILVAHNAVNPSEFILDKKARFEYRQTIGVREEDILVGYLGSYAFYHDPKRLILAAQLLKYQHKSNIKILMVGVGKDYKLCYNLAQKLGLLNSIILMRPLVPKEDVPKVLASLDIAVLPGSTDIICPIKVQEYMAMELPSVVPDYPANREVIKDGENGILFKPKDEKSLTERLLYLSQNADLRRSIGKNARQEIIDKFTWEKTWGKVLQDIIARLEKRSGYLRDR